MATGPLFESNTLPPEGQAVIYVFRPDQDYARAVAPDLMVDGKPAGAIQNGGYLVFNVEPGKHTIDIPYNFWSYGDCVPATVATEAGEIHYV